MLIKKKSVLIGAFACASWMAPWASATSISFLGDPWAALNPEAAGDHPGGGGSHFNNPVGGNDGGNGVEAVPLPSPALLGILGLGVVAGVHRRRPAR